MVLVSKIKSRFRSIYLENFFMLGVKIGRQSAHRAHMGVPRCRDAPHAHFTCPEPEVFCSTPLSSSLFMFIAELALESTRGESPCSVGDTRGGMLRRAEDLALMLLPQPSNKAGGSSIPGRSTITTFTGCVIRITTMTVHQQHADQHGTSQQRSHGQVTAAGTCACAHQKPEQSRVGHFDTQVGPSLDSARHGKPEVALGARR